MVLMLKIARFLSRMNDAFNEAWPRAKRHVASIRLCRKNEHVNALLIWR